METINIKNLLIVFGLSMLPISEIRGAVIYGFSKSLPFRYVFLVSFIGNLMPVIPLYFLLEKIFKFTGKFKLGKVLNTWLINRTKSKSKIVEIYKTIGLLIFVGIPLPMTGAWTGVIASIIFQLKFKSFLSGIIGGILLAGLIVSSITYGIKFFL